MMTQRIRNRGTLSLSWWKQQRGEPKGSVLRNIANLPTKPTLIKLQADTSGRTLLVYDEQRTFMREFHGAEAERIMAAVELSAFDKTYVMAHFNADGDLSLDGDPLHIRHWPSW